MSKQEAIEMLKALNMMLHSPDGKPISDVCDALGMAIEALQDDWIPVSERLPEKNELVLVTVWNDVVIAWRNLYGGWESAEDVYGKGNVTAWKPLPKPYKSGDDNE